MCPIHYYFLSERESLLCYIVYIVYSGHTTDQPLTLNIKSHTEACHKLSCLPWCSQWQALVQSPCGSLLDVRVIANQVVDSGCWCSVWHGPGIFGFVGSRWMKPAKCICHFYWQLCHVSASINAKAQDMDTSPGTMCSLIQVWVCVCVFLRWAQAFCSNTDLR